jgi:50S ribosomal protein L16 3-hydroxylase
MNHSPKKQINRKSLSRLLPLLGGISAEKFLRDYWQKKPLLIRNAVADFKAPVTKREVLTLSCREEAESRMIARTSNRWQIEHGPFSASDFRQPKDTLWTVLVQDVQHFSYEAHELLAKFNFLPQARIDDLMVSYAVPGAGVGAHFDTYDVFLLQGLGRRRWQISRQTDLRLKPDMPLKILSHFKPTEEFVLDTGDMLYLPPSVAHNGIAETECLTWSIGFRSPSKQDLTVSFLDYLRDALQLAGQYADPDLKTSRHPAEIDAAMQRRIAKLLEEVQKAARDQALMRRFTGCYLTEPKAHVLFDAPETPLSLSAFVKQATRHGIELDLKARILYDTEHVFINGEAHSLSRESEGLLKTFADTRALSATALVKAQSRPALAFLYKVYLDGAATIARH